jgi:hypothetical protein
MPLCKPRRNRIIEVGYLNFVHSMQAGNAIAFAEVSLFPRVSMPLNETNICTSLCALRWDEFCVATMASLSCIDDPRGNQPKAKQNDAAVARHGYGKWDIHDHNN